MSATHPFVLDGPSGPLHGLVDLPARPGPRPAVVICHGFKGFMEWGFFPHLATLLAERGFTVVRFNLWGSGMRPGEDRVGDLAAFRADTHGREVADLLAVIAAAAAGGIAPGRIDPARLGLLGHSRGGGASVLAAAGPEGRGGPHPIAALVTWAAVAAFDRYSPEQKAAWRRDGFLPVVNARTGQELPMGIGLLADLEANAAALDVERAASRVAAPWLIVHGEADETVAAEDARRLDRARPPGQSAPRELLLIPGATHTFGARHPFAGPTPHLIQAMNATQRWFRRYLADG